MKLPESDDWACHFIGMSCLDPEEDYDQELEIVDSPTLTGTCASERHKTSTLIVTATKLSLKKTKKKKTYENNI